MRWQLSLRVAFGRGQRHQVRWGVVSRGDSDVLHQSFCTCRDGAKDLQKLAWSTRIRTDSACQKLVQAVASVHGAVWGETCLQYVQNLVESTNVLVDKRVPGDGNRCHARQDSHAWGNIGDTQLVILRKIVNHGTEEADDGTESITTQHTLHE